MGELSQKVIGASRPHSTGRPGRRRVYDPGSSLAWRAMTELHTPRLLLRQWRDSDLDPFAALNADPEVMRYFSVPLTRERSDALAARQRQLIAERGWGLWAVEVVELGRFIGFVG